MAELLRIGVIGAGNNGRNHATRLLDSPDCVVPAIADRNRAAEAIVRAMHPKGGEPAFFTDYRQMLRDVALDAVVLSTPHALHHDQITAALERGLHVLTEKPMVCTVAEARSVMTTVRRTGKRLLVSYQKHLSPIYRYMRKVIADGELGKILFTQGFVAQNWLEAQRGAWRQDPKLSGGGQLSDTGSHLLDSILWVTALRPKRVSAFIENFDVPVDVNSTLNVQFIGGAAGDLAVLGAYPYGGTEHATIVGTAGALHYDNRLGKPRLMQVRSDGTPTEVLPPGSGPNPDQHFVDVLLGRCESLLEPATAVLTTALTEAAHQSAANAGAPADVKSV